MARTKQTSARQILRQTLRRLPARTIRKQCARRYHAHGDPARLAELTAAALGLSGSPDLEATLESCLATLRAAGVRTFGELLALRVRTVDDPAYDSSSYRRCEAQAAEELLRRGAPVFGVAILARRLVRWYAREEFQSA